MTLPFRCEPGTRCKRNLWSRQCRAAPCCRGWPLPLCDCARAGRAVDGTIVRVPNCSTDRRDPASRSRGVCLRRLYSTALSLFRSRLEKAPTNPWRGTRACCLYRLCWYCCWCCRFHYHYYCRTQPSIWEVVAADAKAMAVVPEWGTNRAVATTTTRPTHLFSMALPAATIAPTNVH